MKTFSGILFDPLYTLQGLWYNGTRYISIISLVQEFYGRQELAYFLAFKRPERKPSVGNLLAEICSVCSYSGLVLVQDENIYLNSGKELKNQRKIPK